MVMMPTDESPSSQGQPNGGKHVTGKIPHALNVFETVEKAGDNGEIVEWPRVVEGRLLYQGEVKVGNHILPVCEEASFIPSVPENPESAAEAFAGNYDGNFPETTGRDVSSFVEIKAPVKYRDGRKEEVKAHLAARGHLVIGALSQSDESASPDGRDLFAPYEHKLAKFVIIISSLSGNCAWYVVEEIRRLLYLRDGRLSRSADLESRKEACSSLARLACLRKSLAEMEDHGRRFTCHSSADALHELEAALAGALAYRSADGKHPAVYIPVASFIPASLYLRVTPAEIQRTLLSVFDRVWGKLGAASRRHTEKISRVAVVLDFSGMSQLDLAAYSTHRLLGDIGEVLRAYCPWLVYKIVLFKLWFAREFLWELFRPALQADCRVVTAEDEEALLQEIQADGTFILHTLGGFNECSVLRCRRPVYRLRQPPQPLGVNEWFNREGEATDFWEEMEKLYEEAPWAPPEGDPVDDIQTRGHDNISAALPRRIQDESREQALQSKEEELEELINRQECAVPHFKKALKQVLNARDVDGEFAKAFTAPKMELTRPVFSMENVTKSDVQICIWKTPKDEMEAAKGTAQMLMKIFEKRNMWTHPFLPSKYMHAFERTTYPLDCVYHSSPVSPMKPQETLPVVRPTAPKDGLMRTAPVKENLPASCNRVALDAINFL